MAETKIIAGLAYQLAARFKREFPPAELRTKELPEK